MCHTNVYNKTTCLKLYFRPILDAYNLLGYGETLSEKNRKFNKQLTTSDFVRHFRKLTCSSKMSTFSSMLQKNKRKICYISVPVVENNKTFRKYSTFFDFFRIFQKVFPRIPGGCRHQESARNRVLDKCYRLVCDFVDLCLTFSCFFRKCFPVSQEVVGIKIRPEIEF